MSRRLLKSASRFAAGWIGREPHECRQNFFEACIIKRSSGPQRWGSSFQWRRLRVIWFWWWFMATGFGGLSETAKSVLSLPY